MNCMFISATSRPLSHMSVIRGHVYCMGEGPELHSRTWEICLAPDRVFMQLHTSSNYICGSENVNACWPSICTALHKLS